MLLWPARHRLEAMVTMDVAKAVADFKGGKVEYRTDRYGNVAVPVGKVSFSIEALSSNLRAILEELERAKPSSAKGRYFKRITLATTMGPGIKVDPVRRDALDRVIDGQQRDDVPGGALEDERAGAVGRAQPLDGGVSVEDGDVDTVQPRVGQQPHVGQLVVDARAAERAQ